MDFSSINSLTSKKIEKNFTKSIAQESGKNFKGTLGSVVNEVNDLQVKAGESIENFASGKIENVHEVMIAMTKAEVSFKFMMETRNKLVSAYKEIMQMQV
ncbi:MAG: flagellar hook-basal body complex protein FliE [Candidatus Scalindua sp. AMX11]|nr:MAG: flagellar hook-basal body complex protein FliE [Candidatus Scalindua sp.]NOG85771.1 flagellar hook-basal body complex protein FliE [Planctomycetota bacterium]RZV97053.1 MAG: flagellar hook-basal body complex protein FliE [Candidatus Scalindua sp. SCAELEC01]TDE66333.1 MAG: flagellar hook-basal body complex protein FliE [Candidatus Scalindua sp. AMX11]GJQ58275.1 MAG: flagellar hook-basal body complex protein FliE [Candidatus Scalindua sp.]